MAQNKFMNLKTVAIAIICLFLLWWLIGKFMGEKGKIRKRLDTLVVAIEKEDPYVALGCFSQDYQDDMGVSFPVIFKIAQTGFGKFEDIDIDLSGMIIEIEGKKATVQMKIWGEATRASTMGKGKLPVREAFEQQGAIIYLTKVGGDWKINSSRKVTLSAAVNF